MFKVENVPPREQSVNHVHPSRCKSDKDVDSCLDRTRWNNWMYCNCDECQ